MHAPKGIGRHAEARQCGDAVDFMADPEYPPHLAARMDGIGLEAAKGFARQGHKVLLHGRSATKLDAAKAAVGGDAEGFLGNDISAGSGILLELVLGDGYGAHSGHYRDNDAGRFAAPNGAAQNAAHVAEVMAQILKLV